MRILPVALMLTTSALAASATGTSALMQSIAERMGTMNTLRTRQAEAGQALTELVGELPPASPDAAMPAPEGNETVAEADGGMLFDANKLCLTYFRNVRVVDPRLQLRCEDSLHIRFPRKSAEQGKKSAKDAASTGHEPTAETPVETPAAVEPAASPQSADKKAPLCINAASALVDAVSNIIFLEGKAGEPLHLVQGDNKLCLEASGEASAALLVDENGDILISSTGIVLDWVDRKGNLCTLRNENGAAYYIAAEHRIAFQGVTHICTSEGTAASEDGMLVTLEAEDVPQQKSGFMPQLSGLRVTGIAAAEATGNVVLTRPAVAERPATQICGQHLAYNGRTGETTVSGKDTSLAYGDYKICTDDSLHIAENGNITLSGSAISGSYVRAASGDAAEPLNGTFSTSGSVVFDAAAHTISFPQGFRAEDAMSRIEIGGRTDLLLLQGDASKVPAREKTGMVNLAIAGYSDVAEVTATGGVSIQYKDKAEKNGLTLAADEAHLNLVSAEATLRASAGRRTSIQYDDLLLAAESVEEGSSLYLAPNGDLTLSGDKVDAALPGKKKPATVSCSDKLVLTRADGKLVLGPGSRLVSEDAILSSRGELYLTLTPGPESKNKPLLKRYPHLVFNYAGISLVDTASGGTVQTDKASMQCTGPIHVEMLPEGESNEMGGIRKATAAGNVAVAGRDTTGRMLRATGDLLTADGTTGMKTLTGSRVTLQDAYNTHIASGKGARVELDKKNNARISGAKQSTAATRIHEQIEKNKKKSNDKK